jgi:SAM-dependent methyltransferase
MSAHVIADFEMNELFSSVNSYYTCKVSRYGATPLGVDWTCLATQELRFIELLKLCNFSGTFSLDDLGCGYGALFAYLKTHHLLSRVDYLGIDLSGAMVHRAKRLWRDGDEIKFILGYRSPRVADYSVASGIFNVMLDQPVDRWERFIRMMLTAMAATSRHGFAVNFMAPQPPGGGYSNIIYRSHPEPWIDFCQQELGLSVELLANYGLQEYTMLLRKPSSH